MTRLGRGNLLATLKVLRGQADIARGRGRVHRDSSRVDMEKYMKDFNDGFTAYCNELRKKRNAKLAGSYSKTSVTDRID